MKTRHSAKLDEDKLRFACELISRARKERTPILRVLEVSLEIMQFGGISIQDMLDWLEATGGEL